MKCILPPAINRITLPAWCLAVTLVFTLTTTLAGPTGFNPALAQSCALSCSDSGCLDRYFGNCGLVMTDVSHASLTSDQDWAHGIVVQSDSKLIATGETNLNGSGTQFAAVRYNPDGTLDNTFGSFDPNTNERTGVVVTTFTYQGVTYQVNASRALALQNVMTPSGVEERLVQAGVIARPGGGYDIAVLRYTTVGDLDPTFNPSPGDGGKLLIPIGSVGIFGCAIQSDCKIVLSGYTGLNWLLLRLNSDGTLDTSFGSGGKATVSFGNTTGNPLAWAVTIQQTPEGERILAAGRSYSAKTSYDFALARLNLDGTLDTSFGTGAKVVTDFARRGDQIRAIAIDQPTGDIVAAGQAYLNSHTSDFALARYDSNGALRSSFGSGGKLTTDFYGHTDHAMGIAIQWNGNVVAGGQLINNGGTYDWCMARYTALGALDSSFGIDGKVVTDFASENDFGGGLALQMLNGVQRIVIAGAAGVADTSSPNYGYNYALARYLE